MLNVTLGSSVRFVDLVADFLPVEDLFSLSYVDKSFRRFRALAVKRKYTRRNLILSKRN